MKLLEELLNHINEGLNYALKNKASLHESIESSLLDLLEEELEKYNANKENQQLSCRMDEKLHSQSERDQK